MIPYDVLVLVPPAGGTLEGQAGACLDDLEARLRASGLEGGHVLALTFFVDAADGSAHEGARRGILGLVRDRFDVVPPPASVVSQAPEGRRVALEAAVLSPPTAALRVARPICEGIPYAVVAGRGIRQVHGAGIAPEAASGPAREAFARMEAILRQEGLHFGHVVRQWGYIEGMLDLRPAGGRRCQGYQAFNDARTLAYAGSPFPSGYPAATGIGQAAGGVVLEFLALDAPGARVTPISNPRQTDAHRYSPGVLVGEPLEDVPGKTAPKFERAKRVVLGGDETILVSGTAAILGEESVAEGDVAAQTRTTLENIGALVGGRRLSRLRAYVKRAEDVPAVRAVCEAAHGAIPALYVQADVCRDELLVEIEGVWIGDPGRGQGGEKRRAFGVSTGRTEESR